MTDLSKQKVSPAALQDAFVADLTRVWEHTLQHHAQDEPYLVALYGTEGGEYAELQPQVLTEAGLMKVAQRYVDEKIYETLEESRENLRYSVADSPTFGEYEQLGLPTVATMLRDAVGHLDETEGYQVLAKAGIAAFKQLDLQGLFGTGKVRARLLLIVITEDTEEDLGLKSAKQANPKPVFEAYRKATAQPPYESTDGAVVSADGQRVFSLRTRSNPKGKPGRSDEFMSDVVALDVIDRRRLRRAWSQTIEGTGVSGRDLCLDPDGQTLLVLLARYRGNRREFLLRRLDAATGTQIHEMTFRGEPIALGVSPNGQIAVGTSDGDVYLVDRAFNPQVKFASSDRPSCLVFLRKTGELLIGGRDSIARVNPQTGEALGVVPRPGFHLSTSADESRIAVSRWFDQNVGKEPFGCAVLSLPEFTVVKEFSLPGHQLVLNEISPDGRRVAFEAHALVGYRIEAQVIDVATGQTLLKRKVGGHKGFVFFPDSQALLAIDVERSAGRSLAIWDPSLSPAS